MLARLFSPKTLSGAVLECAQILLASRLLSVSQVAASEAEQLVSAAYRRVNGVNLSRFDLLLRAHEPFPESSSELLLAWTEARSAGQPLQYLIGYQTFFEHEYEVGPEVLIPRPETECLVAEVIRWFDHRGQSPSAGMEIGLGSGAISIELLSRWKGLEMVASELSFGAIDVAVKNAGRILGAGEVGRLKVLKVDQIGDVLEPFLGLSAPVDFLVTNPPYLKIDPSEVADDVMAYEPHLALFAPQEDLLYFYRKIAVEGKFFLKANGVVFAELPHERDLSIAKLFEDEGWKTRFILDLSQRNRVLIAQPDSTEL